MKRLFLFFILVGLSHIFSYSMELVKKKEATTKNTQEYIFGNLTQLPPELRYLIFLKTLKELHASNQFNKENLFHLDMLAFCNCANQERSNRELLSFRAPFKIRCFHSTNRDKHCVLKKINTKCFVLAFKNKLQIWQLVDGKWKTQIFTTSEGWQFASIDEKTFFSLSQTQSKGTIWKLQGDKWSKVQNFELDPDSILKKNSTNNIFIQSRTNFKILCNKNDVYFFQSLDHKNAYILKVLSDNKLLTTSRKDGIIKIWNFQNGKWEKTHQLNHTNAWNVKKINDNSFLSASEACTKLWQFLKGKWIEQILDHDTCSIKRVNDNMFLIAKEGHIKVWCNLDGIWNNTQILIHKKYSGFCLSLLNENTCISYGDKSIKIWHRVKNFWKEKYGFHGKNEYFTGLTLFNPIVFLLGKKVYMFNCKTNPVSKQELERNVNLNVFKVNDGIFSLISREMVQIWQSGKLTTTPLPLSCFDRLQLNNQTFVTNSYNPKTLECKLTILTIPTIKEILENIKQERKGKHLILSR